jgi:hypothetical protein
VLGVRGFANLALPGEARTAFGVRVLSTGADVTRAGGARIQVRDEGGTLTQVCNGPCDDLRFEAQPHGEDVYGVDVLNAAGACVACGQGQYVDRSYGAETTELRVAGDAPLRVNISIGSEATRGPQASQAKAGHRP